MPSQAARAADQTRDNDEERTKRLFIGFLSSALGVDQITTDADSSPYGGSPGYTIANPDGTYSALGQPVSNLNAMAAPAAGIPPGLLMLGLAVLVYALTH